MVLFFIEASHGVQLCEVQLKTHLHTIHFLLTPVLSLSYKMDEY